MKNFLKDLWKIAKIYKWYEFMGLIFTILYTIAVYIAPRLSRYLIDDVIPSNSIQKLKVGILVFLIGCLCQPIFSYLKDRIFMNVSENMTILFREKMFNKIINAPMDFFDNSNNGAIVSRISNDGRSISVFITNFFIVFLKNIILIAMILIQMMIYSKEITLIVVFLYLTFFFFNWKISKKFSPMSKEIQKNYDQICIKINRSVTSINTIKAFNRENQVKDEFKEIIETSYLNNISFRKLTLFINSFGNAMTITSLAIIYGMGSLFVMNGTMTVGTIVALGLYFQILVQPVYEILNTNIDMHTLMPILDRINEYINLGTEKTSDGNSDITHIEEIEMRNVGFKYKNGSQALNNINFKLPSKGIFAFVGDSGAGKSSLIKLLSAFYNSYDGEIKINQKELKSYGVSDVRKVIRLVSQDIELLNESIKDNIKMGRDIEESQIEKVIKKLNLEETIDKLEERYETIINERVNLSGGEKQRISIARALVEDSLVYIFDEPTAALDTINEKKVKDILEELSKDRLVIIITHNLSLLNKADCIYTMKSGEIVEKGNYETLIKGDTYFSKLINELSRK
ncbi:ABC transporter permease [Paraclostridium benzoelyticum]|uniref:ABC transporter permease n=1 Tax=Paraclostridium benzoelyticum TaxID=1629550 RepID=A0A0M3DH02_9FIRM|nr:MULTISPECIES: ABC transporter ATP-binding protein [Paraclostridium]KKY01578.1 ABC transporter permease [Paraclostridium benzoelyticum]MBS5953804.1 ABC transporter ATP-binding protein [Paraclostridium bifermentans]